MKAVLQVAGRILEWLMFVQAAATGTLPLAYRFLVLRVSLACRPLKNVRPHWKLPAWRELMRNERAK